MRNPAILIINFPNSKQETNNLSTPAGFEIHQLVGRHICCYSTVILVGVLQCATLTVDWCVSAMRMDARQRLSCAQWLGTDGTPGGRIKTSIQYWNRHAFIHHSGETDEANCCWLHPSHHCDTWRSNATRLSSIVRWCHWQIRQVYIFHMVD